MSKLATPKPASPINSDMSHVIDDATSAMHDTYDETTYMLATTVPLGEFLDEQLARARENEIIEADNIEDSDDEDSPPNKYELPVVAEGYVLDEEAARAILACNDRYDLKKLLAKWKQQSLNARIKPDPAFATSPICITDKDSDFSVEPELITLLNLILFMAMNLKLLWHILLN